MLIGKVVKALAHKFGLDIVPFKPSEISEHIVSLKTQGTSKGTVLLAYLIEPFLENDRTTISSKHTNHLESVCIAETFLDLGYDVDVIDYRYSAFRPQKAYTAFFSARVYFEPIAKRLNPECIKIVHLDTAHWSFNNTMAFRRSLEMAERKGTAVYSMKRIEPNYAIEHADVATFLGNQFTEETYRFAGKPMHRLPVPSYKLYDWPEHKDFEQCRKRFFWMGSVGLVHKGLDLVLEAFAQLPDFELVVCGPIDETPRFKQVYHEELFERDTIENLDWIDIAGPEFIEKVQNRCIGLVYPSASEGQSGAVVTCMQAGLIPIISYESGVDVDDFGIILNQCTIDEITSAVRRISELPAPELKAMSRRTWQYAQANHSQENYRKRLREVLEEILL